MKIFRVYILIFFSLCLFIATRAEALDGKAVIEKSRCAGCHDMKGPAAATKAELLKRSAPDLFYAGSKFQEKFLTEFLQKPHRLRPAGFVFLNHVKAGDERDQLSEPPLCQANLAEEDARLAAQYLMSLKDPQLKSGVYSLDAGFSKARAKLIFFKSGACNACHQVEDSGSIKGGLSGPVLYDAGSRLNGDWVFDYIKDPKHWNPVTLMPKRDLPDSTWLLLTNFVMSMGKEELMEKAEN